MRSWESREERREDGVVRPQGPRDEQVPLGQPDEDPARGPELAHEMFAHSPSMDDICTRARELIEQAVATHPQLGVATA